MSKVLSSSASPASHVTTPEKDRTDQEEREQSAEQARLEEERKQAAEQARLEGQRKQAAERAQLEKEESDRQAAAEKTRLEREQRERLAAEEKARLEQQERERLAATEKARLDQEERERLVALAAAEKSRQEEQERERLVTAERDRHEQEERERLAAEQKARLDREKREARPDGEKDRLGRRKGLILGIVATVLVVGAVVAYLVPKQVTVPDLNGNTLTDATAKLQALKLAVGRTTPKEDATKDPNVVLSQSPPANTRVKGGTAVDLILSQRPQPATTAEVPDLVGKSLEAARQVLRERHLAVGNVSQESRSGVAQNVVLDEFPKAGRKVDPGTAIDLVVSETPIATGGASQVVQVPKVVGMLLNQASAQLQEQGLSLGNVTRVLRADVAPDTVLIQSPSSGQEVQRASRIDLTVSESRKLLAIADSGGDYVPLRTLLDRLWKHSLVTERPVLKNSYKLLRLESCVLTVRSEYLQERDDAWRRSNTITETTVHLGSITQVYKENEPNYARIDLIGPNAAFDERSTLQIFERGDNTVTRELDVTRGYKSATRSLDLPLPPNQADVSSAATFLQNIVDASHDR